MTVVRDMIYTVGSGDKPFHQITQLIEKEDYLRHSGRLVTQITFRNTRLMYPPVRHRVTYFA